MVLKFLFITIFFFTLVEFCFPQKLLPPDRGIYHGAFPGMGPTEDVVTKERIYEFEQLVGRKIVWAFFSNNWFDGIKFPFGEVEETINAGRIPFIRMMPRSDWREGELDPRYSLERIINGEYDDSLKIWFGNARDVGSPLLVSFGTEANGNWFPWSGIINGGPWRFAEAYRHVINLSREVGATNITWFFHMNGIVWPKEDWNQYSNYYPGDDYIDWIGVSIYGAQVPGEYARLFTSTLDEIYDELKSVSATKPLAILEFATIESGTGNTKAEWINDAVGNIKNGNFPRIKAISWWHSNFYQRDGGLSDMRLDSSPEALEAYRFQINDSVFITTPVFSN